MYHDLSYHGLSGPHRERGAANPLLTELIAVLEPHPKGLRRWSVMRAIRKNREAQSRDIPLKLEADVERTFRQYCAGDTGLRSDGAGKILFCRPAEKAGEVWAMHPDYANAPPENL